MTEAVNPASVPSRTMYTGDVMPAIGMGTFGSARFTTEQISGAVAGAIEARYSLFDCASC